MFPNIFDDVARAFGGWQEFQVRAFLSGLSNGQRSKLIATFPYLKDCLHGAIPAPVEERHIWHRNRLQQMEMPVELPLDRGSGERLGNHECDVRTHPSGVVAKPNGGTLGEWRVADAEIAVLAEISERQEIVLDYPWRFRRDVNP